MVGRRAVWVLVALAAAAVPRAAEAQERLGPSFACPVPRDPLGQLICATPRLAEEDLAFVQAYQALRQQSTPVQQGALRAEAASFGRAVRVTCGIGAPAGPNDPLPAAPGAEAAGCVEREYGRQRAAWTGRLQGAAAQEAMRPLQDQVALQGDLQVLGLLPADSPADGVYGPATRTAVVAFQQTMGFPATGLIGQAEAEAIVREAASRTVRPAPPPAPAPVRTAWDDFQSEAASAGLRVVAHMADPCLVSLEVSDPRALAEAARSGGDDPFAAEMTLLQTRVAARAVHALYASAPPGVDRCGFQATAFTTDIYGRDVPQPLFAFQFDRATYAKVVWNRFDPANMPKIMLAFEYGGYASQRLGLTRTKPEPAVPAMVAPPAPPAPPAPAAPAAVSRPASEQASAAAADPVLVRWSGVSTMTTRPFHVDGPWELRWSSDGPFSAVLHQLDGDEVHVVAEASGRASSSAFWPKGGDYYLEVTTTAPWTASVVRFDR